MQFSSRLLATSALFALAMAAPALAVDKVSFGTNWLAEGEHGGFYQAVADGTYAKYGLDVTIVQGGPQAANEARKAEVPVYTIAYGTQNGYVDLDGKREPVPPDVELLGTIASMTGGSTYEAESLPELERVYSNLRSEVGMVPVKKETTALWAGYGLAFAVVAALAAVSLGARWP